jgi:hypothetical protein
MTEQKNPNPKTNFSLNSHQHNLTARAAMAHYKSTLKISGSIGDLTLTKNGIAKMKSSLDKHKFRTKRRMANSRRTAKEFGGISKFASELCYTLPEHMRKPMRKFAHNHICSQLSKNMRIDNDTDRSLLDLEATLPVLHQLDLSRCQQLSKKLRIRTKGHPLQATEIKINGLRDMADSIPPLRDHEIKLRISFHIVQVPTVTTSPDEPSWRAPVTGNGHDQPSTGWLSPAWIPEEGLSIALSNPFPDNGALLFISIQWMHCPLRKTTIKAPTETEMYNWSVIKVAATFRPLAHLSLPIPSYLQTAPKKRFRLLAKTQKRRSIAACSPLLKLRLRFPMPSHCHTSYIPQPAAQTTQQHASIQTYTNLHHNQPDDSCTVKENPSSNEDTPSSLSRQSPPKIYIPRHITFRIPRRKKQHVYREVDQ